MTADVRDVRADVRSHVRAERLVAVGVCGTCGHSPSCGRARDAGNVRPTRINTALPRTYACPHVPHVPHVTTAATLSGDSLTARKSARPALALARAVVSAHGLSKEMEREGLAA